VLDQTIQDVPGLAHDLAGAHGGETGFVYEHAIKGFALKLPPAAVEGLAHNPHVISIEPDHPAQIYSVTASSQSSPASWGLDRIDQSDLPLDDASTFNNSGAGINIYVIDSGIRISHHDFGGRAAYVPSAENGNFVGDGHGSAEDCYGHGTGVAAVAAGNAHGVAKGADVWALRVLDCEGDGYASMALAAVDWITANGQLPGVVNMSLGFPDSPALAAGVANSAAVGFVYTAASGNFIVPQDACELTPANVPGVITVGATDASDQEASWSGWGTCVSLLAPGVGITTASNSGDDATIVTSGTSQAAPHVAGAAALYLTEHPGASAFDVLNGIAISASPGRITLHGFSDQGGTPNRLLHSNFLPPPPNVAPTAVMNPMCTTSECTFSGSASTDSDGWVVGHQWDFGDGFADAGESVSHQYAESGTYTVSLTVVDDDGAEHTVTQDLVVEVINEAPLAALAFCSNEVTVTSDGPRDREMENEADGANAGLQFSFDASASSEKDGTIARYLWDFGDGDIASGVRADHTYDQEGIYTVTLTVVDNRGQPETATTVIAAVAEGGGDGITLGAEWLGADVDLQWTGARFPRVRVIRDGSQIATVGNEGSYRDRPSPGSGVVSYRVCDVIGPDGSKDDPSSIE
jgi:subtilisin family serine protease